MGRTIRVVFPMCWVLITGLVGVVFADDSNDKEIGYMHQGGYGIYANPNPCIHDVLMQVMPFCTRLTEVLRSKGKWDVHGGAIDGDPAVASAIENTGLDKADMVDLYVWAGHGPRDASDGSGTLHFRSNHTSELASDCNVEHSECSWGEGDCEFVVCYTCSFLGDWGHPDVLTSIKKMCQGVHVICGATGRIEIIGDQGPSLGVRLMGQRGWFAKQFDPQPVTRAWLDSCRAVQDPGREVAVIYHTSTKYDYISGNLDWASGKRMSSDPPPCTDINLADYVKTTYVCGNPLPL